VVSFIGSLSVPQELTLVKTTENHKAGVSPSPPSVGSSLLSPLSVGVVGETGVGAVGSPPPSVGIVGETGAGTVGSSPPSVGAVGSSVAGERGRDIDVTCVDKTTTREKTSTLAGKREHGVKKDRVSRGGARTGSVSRES